MPHVEVLGRDECSLCTKVEAVVHRAAEAGLCTWEKVDVDRDKALLVRYGVDVPVVRIDGEVRFRHFLSGKVLREALREATC